MKRPFLLSACLAIAVVAIPVATALAQRRTDERRGGERRSDGPERRDWTKTVARTDEGGMRMGDADAPVKVIQYVSLVAEGNARFLADGGERLFINYVSYGRVSIEYRNLPANAFDLAAAMLSRCAAPRDYFAMTHYLLSHQPEWMGRAASLSDSQRNELRGLPMLQALQRIVPMIGLDRIASRHEISRVAQQSCMADQAALDRLQAGMQQAQAAHGVRAAPAFVVNGQRVEAQSWAALEPLLGAR